MRIVNLVENEVGSSGCEAAHGLSFYIETEKHKLLFDTGGGRSPTAIPGEFPNYDACSRVSDTDPSEVVLRNAQRLGIGLSAVDTVILSHGHYDHSGGILPFSELNPRAKIYMQHNAGGEFYAFDGEEKGYRYIGIDKKILSLPQVQLLHGDTKLDDELQLFTVDVERRTYPLPSTNARLRELCGGVYSQDDFSHEQNLLLTTSGKKILFCGCAHNGILNVLDALERKFGTGALPDLVIGGFHLMNRAGKTGVVADRAAANTAAPGRATQVAPAEKPATKATGTAELTAPGPAELTAEVTEIANRLKSYKAHFATCHCTGLAAFNQMKEIMGDQLSYVYSGDELKKIVV